MYLLGFLFINDEIFLKCRYKGQMRATSANQACRVYIEAHISWSSSRGEDDCCVLELPRMK